MEAIEGTVCCAKDCDKPVSTEARTPLGSGMLVLPLCAEHYGQWTSTALWPIEIVSSYDTRRARFESQESRAGSRLGRVEPS